MAIELLSPAGNYDKLVAAFSYGADAAYMGMTEFSLRHNAGNFSDAAASLRDIELLFNPLYVKGCDADPSGFDDIGEGGRIILMEEKGFLFVKNRL